MPRAFNFDTIQSNNLEYAPTTPSYRIYGNRVYMGGEIYQDISVYSEILELLKSDVTNITIDLSCEGGDLVTGFALCHAIKQSKAQVSIHIIGPSLSMGAILALCGDSLTMCPNAYLMFHNFSIGTKSTKGKEAADELQHVVEYYNNNLRYFCTPFLTPSEISSIILDQDVYIWNKSLGTSYKQALQKRIDRHFNLNRRK